MGRLADAGILSLVWKEEEDGTIYADALQYYEIDSDNELAIFQGDKCVAIRPCPSLDHAVSTAAASESVCRANIRMGETYNGKKVNERGWLV